MALHTAVAAAVRAGAVTGADTETITVGLWAVVHGLTSLELGGSLDAGTTADAVWSTTVDAVLAGMRR